MKSHLRVAFFLPAVRFQVVGLRVRRVVIDTPAVRFQLFDHAPPRCDWYAGPMACLRFPPAVRFQLFGLAPAAL